MSTANVEGSFRNAMRAVGLETRQPLVVDDKRHRFHVEGDRAGTQNGVYQLHPDGYGWYGTWKENGPGAWHGWSAKRDSDLTTEERQLRHRLMEQGRHEAEVESAKQHSMAAARARAILDAAAPANADHPYLLRKKVGVCGGVKIGYWEQREKTNCVLIPMHDADRNLCNVHAIFPEVDPKLGRDKDFLLAGKKTGCYFMIGRPTDVIYIAEGYATAASIHEATGMAVAVAFDARNLEPVARALRTKYPDIRIVLCADDDQFGATNTGVDNAKEAARAVNGWLALPRFPDLTGEPTDFNDLHQREGLAAVQKYIEAAQPVENDEAAASVNSSKDRSTPFKVSDGGVFYIEDDEPRWICSRLDVDALVRDPASGNWGRLLRFLDPDGTMHTWSMPMEMLSGSGEELRAELMRQGLQIAPSSKARARLAEYLMTANPEERARCVNRLGWHDKVFVLPNRTIGQTTEQVIYQSQAPSKDFAHAGTLDEWRDQVAALCVGNSRLLLSVSSAFAAMLLYPTGTESGGLHLVGQSSTGKTTALRVAASVYGGPDYLRTWRGTSNGLEGIATLRSDTLLVLDELAQVNPHEAGDIAYMLANGNGKVRAGRNGAARSIQEWRILFLSAGEIGLAQHMAQIGKKAKAGQEVRLVDIPADAGAGMGMFEQLHGRASGAELSKTLTQAATRYYGTPALAFLEAITKPGELERAATEAKKLRDKFVADNLPNGAGGQATRVAERFGLLAAAGELASNYGITGWNPGQAQLAAATCFKAWLEQRGGVGNQERGAILAQVRAFFELHGLSRFADWCDLSPRTSNRAGFRKIEGDDIRYFVLPGVFQNEICAGHDPRQVAKYLVEAGWVQPDHEGKSSRSENLPGMGKTRCYVFLPKMWR